MQSCKWHTDAYPEGQSMLYSCLSSRHDAWPAESYFLASFSSQQMNTNPFDIRLLLRNMAEKDGRPSNVFRLAIAHA
jgi:hypothetical protein